MLNVYLNNGNLIIFEKAKATFENGKLFVNSKPTLNHNFDYEKDLKEVYKVEECTCRNGACIAITQRTIYRGELLKRGVYNIIYLFALPKNNIPPHSKKY